jgi:tyrosyl-tRNA synthetase
MQDFYKEIEWRGFVHTNTPGVDKHLQSGQITAYIGFDPTAPSLHVGSLLPIMGLVHFQRSGHLPIAVAGGGTGMVGDPSGKTQERKLLSLDELKFNLEGIKKQFSHFLDFKVKSNPAKMVNNAEWLTTVTLMDFLREFGKHFSINEMLAKESVKNRVEQEQGMSFTEFTYSLLQSYDYLQLYDRYHCTLQMGGSDQWGNITSGIDLIRRLRGGEAHAIVFPLITTSGGVKFGKTECGTIWLDSQRTSPYKFYQYWFNTDDRDVVRYLKYFTLLTKDKIDELENAVKSKPEKREAQVALAREVTKRLHGDTALDQAVKASAIFFGGEITEVSDQELLDIFSDVPSREVPKSAFDQDGCSIVELLVTSGAAKSKGEARRFIQGGGIYLNNRRVEDVEKKVAVNETIHGKYLVLRRGGRNYWLVKIL